MDGLNPDFEPRLQRLLDNLRQQGYEFGIGEGYRSPQRQLDLYAQGRTKPGPIVTYLQSGYHQHGAAADLTPPRGMSESEAARILDQTIRSNPDLGVRGIGSWDPFHVQLGQPLSTLGGATAQAGTPGAPMPGGAPAGQASPQQAGFQPVNFFAGPVSAGGGGIDYGQLVRLLNQYGNA